MAKRGRKSKADIVYENLDKIEEWAKNGATEEQIANSLGISVSAFSKYKNENKELSDVLKKSRMKLVVDLKSALVKKALGFHYEEQKQYIREDENGKKTLYTEKYKKYSPPDVAALNSALQNYDGDWYRDKQAIELKRQELELKKKMAEDKEW